jgi:hypothetical protein
MDNNFYDVPRGRRKAEKAKQTHFMSRVIAVQFILSLLITCVLFLVCRSDSKVSQNIKDIYSEACKTDIAVSEIFSSLKSVVKETFSPNVEKTINEIETTTGES